MKTVFIDWRIGGYNLLLILLSPYILWRKFRRARSRNSPHEFDWRRWKAPAAMKSPEGGKRVVLLCTGMGEVQIAAELTQRLKEQSPDLDILWAIRRSDVERWAQSKDVGQPTTTIPFDFFWPCRRWLDAIKPDVIISMERLWWPNLLWLARRRGIKTLAVAANDFARIKHPFWSAINRWTLQGFDFIGFQSEDEKGKLGCLLKAENVGVTGILKWFEVEKPQVNAELQNWLGPVQCPIFVAGSTHEGEEEFVLEAFGLVRRESECALLIAPRQIHRIEAIEQLCCAKGWKVQRRSRSRGAGDIKPDILLLDTMGELSAVYSVASSAFIGGTLRGVGHNVMEPLIFNVPIAFGHGGKTGKISDVQRAVLHADIGRQVASAQMLADFWQQSLRGSEATAERAQRFEQFRYNQLLFWRNTVAEIMGRI